MFLGLAEVLVFEAGLLEAIVKIYLWLFLMTSLRKK